MTSFAHVSRRAECEHRLIGVTSRRAAAEVRLSRVRGLTQLLVTGAALCIGRVVLPMAGRAVTPNSERQRGRMAGRALDEAVVSVTER